jgi:hypothetical protein
MSEPEPCPEPFEVYAIRYARHQRTAAANFLGGDAHDGPMPLDYFVWLLRGPAGTYVVDTGFDAGAAKARGRELLRPVAEGLAAMGVDPAAVRDDRHAPALRPRRQPRPLPERPLPPAGRRAGLRHRPPHGPRRAPPCL